MHRCVLKVARQRQRTRGAKAMVPHLLFLLFLRKLLVAAAAAATTSKAAEATAHQVFQVDAALLLELKELRGRPSRTAKQQKELQP